MELRAGARREPNTRGDDVELFDGLEATSQNRFPSLRFDLGAINSLASPILIAGFYYKTFMWPAAFWEKLYEPLIRRSAGLGRASGETDPDRYEKAFAHCDVLVVGGGPAGLSAALAAGRAGARVILCDDDFRLGGRLLTPSDSTIDGRPGANGPRMSRGNSRRSGNVRIIQPNDGIRRLRQRRLWRAGARRGSSADAAAASAAPAALADRRRARGAGRRRARAADRLRRQRSAGRDAGLGAYEPISIASAWRAAATP